MRLSIGAKINTLIVSTLVVSVCGTMWIGTRLFGSDLDRMVHKGALDRATVLAGRVRNEMSSAARLVAIVGNASLLDFRFDEDRIRFIESVLGSDPTLLGVSLYEKSYSEKLPARRRFRPVWRAASPAPDPSLPRLSREDLELLDREFPLHLNRAEKGDIDFRVARLRDGSPSLRMALPFVERSPGLYSQLIVVEISRIRLNQVFEESTEFTSYLLDSHGTVLSSTDPARFPAGYNMSWLPFLKNAKSGRSLAAEQDLTDAWGVRQIAAYQNTGFADLIVVSQAPQMHSSDAKAELQRRSFLLGWSVLFIALIVSFHLGGAIVRPVLALSGAAERMAEGDFSVRVSMRRSRWAMLVNDEVHSLTGAFNTMATRIGTLMSEVGHKARMEKELETARLVQTRFFPQRPFESDTLRVAGRSMAASECGGDWWNYRQVGGWLFVAMGDVTGHGVSAALVTSAAHFAFSRFMRKHAIEAGSEATRWKPEAALRKLLEELNWAVHDTADGQAWMTCNLSAVSLETGEIYTMSASHPPPIVVKAGSERVRALRAPACPALGQKPSLDPSFCRYQLHPGDIVLWHTDGLTECANAQGKKFRKLSLLKTVRDLRAKGEADPQTLCDESLREVSLHLGPQTLPEDDITLVVAVVSDAGSGSRSNPPESHRS